MKVEWTEARLEALINDQIEESLSLEYKASGALVRSDRKKKEITKDVSAMANSAGGVIIYGIAEFGEKAQSHRPEKIDPIDRTEFSKEWLDQVIDGIQPRITGVKIHPVDLSSEEKNVAYVVEIPQSLTAHQARDFRYYKRSNFKSSPMEDYEIRDIMGRAKDPKIEINFEFLEISQSTGMYLHVGNVGSVVAKHVCVYLKFPFSLNFQPCVDVKMKLNPLHYESFWKNIHKDYVCENNNQGEPKYFASRYDPILPQMKLSSTYRPNVPYDKLGTLQDETIEWTIYADNAMPKSGSIQIGDIPQ